MRKPLTTLALQLTAVPVIVSIIILGSTLMTPIGEVPIYNQKIPLFNPHMPTFICELEARQLPPIDAQAEAWFLQARELDSPEIFFRDRDYTQMLQLTRQAAQRHHWKAMLNLASLYLDGHDRKYGRADALALVEQGMKLGMPAAYDRMGTYLSNGTGVKADATRAYAFWQKAAQMGSSAAMGFLGKELDAVYDSPENGWWANRPIGLKMMKCALGQGDGKAAYYLSMAYENQPGRDATNEEKLAALLAVHHGTRLGCEDCANKLSIQFDHPFDPVAMIVPFIDKARAERYSILGDALFFDPNRRFPNLDKVLPLPPAQLPPWNGDRDTLVKAAMGVTPVPFLEAPTPGAAAANVSRFVVPPPFALHNTKTTTTAPNAPKEGYWRPLGANREPVLDAAGKPIPPGLYKQGELFGQFAIPDSKPVKLIEVSWEYWITTWGDREAVEPRAPRDLIRVVPRPLPLLSREQDAICPRTGTWQPWVPADHPLAQLVNQHWRQAWVVAGQPFPQPKTDWWIELPDIKLTWHLMDDAPVDINQPVPRH